MEKHDDPEVIEAIEALRAAGVMVELPAAAALPARAQDTPLMHWVLDAAKIGFTFELEGPANEISAGSIWNVEGSDFLRALIDGMRTIAPEYFGAKVVSDQLDAKGENHVLSFELYEDVYTLEVDVDDVEDSHDYLTMVFDLVNGALDDSDAPCAFIGVEGPRVEGAPCTYRVLSVDSGSVTKLGGVLPYRFGPTEDRGAVATIQMARVTFDEPDDKSD